MRSRFPIFAVLFILTLMAAACGPQAAPGALPAYGAPGASAAPATAMPPTAMPPATSAATDVPPGAQPPPAGSSGAAQIALATDPTLGSILVDGNGMTLYLFTKDSPNNTTCYGKCATSWPPLLASAGNPALAAGLDASKLGTVTRTDGTTQVTYNGWPLYYFAKDHKAGDVTGQGVGKVWYVVTPSGDPVK
jgi:predicted lipoprotein with Yx(FWY)xxD motif